MTNGGDAYTVEGFREEGHGNDGFTSSSSSSSTIVVNKQLSILCGRDGSDKAVKVVSLESSTSCTSQSMVTVSNIVFYSY